MKIPNSQFSILNSPKGSPFDVLIIGGGIQGAGCAQAFAAEGNSVLLLEQNTWASGTSSKSSKLIHGGLRYLETYQFGLVRKALQERARMMTIAPDLMTPRKFYIPIYKGSKFSPWKIRIGLCLYSLLGGFDSLSRFKKIPKNQWSELGGIKTENLKAVFQYWDTQTNDKRLTQAVISSAQELGATTLENAHFEAATQEADHYTFTYQYNNEQHTATCKLIINAAGPWVSKTQQTIQNAPPPPSIEKVQGAHIELEGQIGEGIIYAESPRDNRPVFIMPWYDRTLVGTTETAYNGDPSKATATQEEIDYLQEVVAHYFPSFKQNFLGSFAGLRVLPITKGNFNARPRDTVIAYDNEKSPRCITLYGGKLTAYRATAEEILSKAAPTLNNPPSLNPTRTLKLPPIKN